MRAAIYARYSTESQDDNSIVGQFVNCETIADANGWRIVARYSDEAISGADESRPEYQRLLADSADGHFDVVIVDETSRITRSPGELPRLLSLLEFRNQFLVDCKGFDSRTETASLLASIYGGIDSLELRKIRDRTHRGLRERHKAGYSAGGKVYGYTTVPVDPTDPKSKRQYEVVEEQAEIVREIFQRYADGESPKAICNDLNARGIASPGSTWKRTVRRCNGWVGTALVGSAKTFTGILRREQYVGMFVWNRRRSKRVPGTSKRVYEIRPKSDWIVSDHPELRIISDSLWRRVQSRLSETRKMATQKQKRPRGRPPRYLLTGILKCGCCGSNFVTDNGRAYVCSSRTNGGKALCENSIRVRRDIAETSVLGNIQEQLLSPAAARYVVESVRKALNEYQRSVTRDQKSAENLKRSLRSVDQKIERVVDAIETSGISSALRSRLARLEAERESLSAALDDAKELDRDLVSVLDVFPGVIRRWREVIEGMADLSRTPHARADDVQEARRQLQGLLGRIELHPRDGELWAHPAVNAKGLVNDEALGGDIYKSQSKVVAGAGFEPATFGL